MTNTKLPSNSTLQGLYNGLQTQLLNEAKAFARLSGHHGEHGAHNESSLLRVLRSQLPRRLDIGTGFLESSMGLRSRQQDIVIFDGLHNSPLYASDDWSIFPVEIVRSTIEVKSKLDRANLSSALEACAGIRTMSPTHAYLATALNGQAVSWVPMLRTQMVPPRFFVFAYEGAWSTFDSFKNAVSEISRENPDAHLHGVCVLDKNWFISRKARGRDVYEFNEVSEHGWTSFLTLVHLMSSTQDDGWVVDKGKYWQTPLLSGNVEVSPPASD